MRLRGFLLVLWAIYWLCSSALAAPAASAATTAAEDKKEVELSSNAVELLDVNTDTTHENESNRKARQFFYPYGGFYGGYGGYYGGLYGYRLYPYYGYGYGYYPGLYHFYG